jgi:hypothetical protein
LISKPRPEFDVLPMVTEATGCIPFGSGLTAALAHQS